MHTQRKTATFDTLENIVETKIPFSTLAAGVSGPVLLAIGTWIPLVKSTLSYTYSVYGLAVFAISALAIALLSLNVLADKTPSDIAKRLQLVALLVTIGCLVYGFYISAEGIDWFYVQTAYDMPSWDTTNKDAFWATLYSYGIGEQLPLVGNLRRGYEAYGPLVALNNQSIYHDSINSLSQEQTRQLVASGGISFSIVPMGIVAYAGCVFSQLVVLVSVFKKQ